MNALLKPVNAIKVLFLLFFSTSFFVTSCKKDDSNQVVPKTALQSKIKGTWEVKSIDEKYYSNNILDSAQSAFVEFETGDLVIEFKGEGTFIATQKGYQPETYALVEAEDGNSFTYAEGQAKAVISLNGDTMTWVETYTASNNGVPLKLVRTFLLTKL